MSESDSRGLTMIALAVSTGNESNIYESDDQLPLSRVGHIS
jgi:hypothetical protein